MDREYFQHAVEEATSSTLHIISRTITIFTYGIMGVYVLSVTIPAKFPSVVMDELPGGVYADWFIYGCDWAWLAWIWYIDHGEFLRKRWMMRRNRSDVGGRSCSLQQETRHGRQGGTKQANWTSPNEIIEQDKYVLLTDDKHYVLWCKYYNIHKRNHYWKRCA